MGPVVAMHGGFTYVGKVRGQGRPRFRRNGSAYETKEDADFKGLWLAHTVTNVGFTLARGLCMSLLP